MNDADNIKKGHSVGKDLAVSLISYAILYAGVAIYEERSAIKEGAKSLISKWKVADKKFGRVLTTTKNAFKSSVTKEFAVPPIEDLGISDTKVITMEIDPKLRRNNCQLDC